MGATLTIRDQSMAPGEADHVFELEFPTEWITVRELIRERVYQEVDDFNRQRLQWAGDFRGLVHPGERGTRDTPARQVDWRAAFDVAVEAYEKRRVIVLVGDRQTESLDERIELGPGAEVTFLRLVMLVGG